MARLKEGHMEVLSKRGYPIQRDSEYGVGKRMGERIYFHKDYIYLVLPKEAVDRINRLAAEFDYNVVCYHEGSGQVNLVEARDFDVADEPTLGKVLTIKPDSTTLVRQYNNHLYHHKWLFVMDDYDGFDMLGSMQRSVDWMALDGVDTAKVGHRRYWSENVLTRL
jgi:hypothetical protein